MSATGLISLMPDCSWPDGEHLNFGALRRRFLLARFERCSVGSPLFLCLLCAEICFIFALLFAILRLNNRRRRMGKCSQGSRVY